ncbi:hypothetical protein, partial [Neisseria dentiae]
MPGYAKTHLHAGRAGVFCFGSKAFRRPKRLAKVSGRLKYPTVVILGLDPSISIFSSKQKDARIKRG